MSQYNTILADRRFPLVAHTDRTYYQRVQNNHWPHYYNDSSTQLTDQVAAYQDNNTWQINANSPQTSVPPVIEQFPQTINAPHPNAFPSLTDYPESSQRTILTSSPDSIETDPHPIYPYKNDQRRSHSSDYDRPTLSWNADASSVDELQYPELGMHEDTEETLVETQCSDSRQSSLPASISIPSLYPSVKVEPEDPDGCFIMELSSMSPTFGLSASAMNQALAPPTEVPLRATQASKEMRKMMGVFRLNPFAMHTGEGRGVMPAPWCGGGPLEEEPLIFEFQLDVEDDSEGQFDLAGMLDGDGITGSRPTDSLGAEEEAQLRSFSPSFELHPEDLQSEMGEEDQEDCVDQDQQNEWSDADYCNHSEVDTSSTTHSVHTPSESRSVHTPFNESQSAYQYPPPAVSTWDIDSYQHGEEHLPPLEKMEGEHKMHRLHTTISHPYLRRSLLNHHQVSPSSSTHSLSQSHPQLHTTLPQLEFGYPLLQQPTHHQHQHYNQAPNQNHGQNYSQHPTFHGSMISTPLSNLELIPVSSHRLEDSIPSSYMRSGRTLKLVEDETSPYHHPAGIVNEYTPRGSTSSAYTSQHDTYPSGHQYETTGVSPSIQHSSLGHAFAPSRRWSLPETIGHSGGSFRSPM